MTPGLKGDTRSRRKGVSHQHQGNISARSAKGEEWRLKYKAKGRLLLNSSFGVQEESVRQAESVGGGGNMIGMNKIVIIL